MLTILGYIEPSSHHHLNGINFFDNYFILFSRNEPEHFLSIYIPHTRCSGVGNEIFLIIWVSFVFHNLEIKQKSIGICFFKYSFVKFLLILSSVKLCYY
jgi:hypothetical protein